MQSADAHARRGRFAFIVLIASLLTTTGSHLVYAQTNTAGIVGVVTDESGAVLPGVTVIARSPSLQVPEISEVTNERGEYRLTLLPQGTYTVTYELAGFRSIRREEIRLGVGFVATVNVPMQIGGVAETVTVSGVSPVVDVTSTAPKTQFIRETLEELPTTRNSQVTLAIQAPGVRISASGFDVGGSKFTTGAQWNKFGRAGDDHALLDGVRIGPQAGDYEDFTSLDEAQVEVMGTSADMAGTGVKVTSIVKSGGNDAHGSAYYSKTGNWAQSDNLDDRLRALGLTGSNKLRDRYDFNGDLGGRIFYNKLWFYMGGRRALDDPIIPGADVRPDGSPGSAPRKQGYYTGKLSYQLSESQRLVGLYQGNWKFNIRAVGPFNTWDSRMLQDQYGQTHKLEWQKIFASNLTANVIYGFWDRNFPTNGMAYGKVATFDQFTQKYTGDHISLFRTPIDANVNRFTAKASISWFLTNFLGGSHDIKTAYETSPNNAWSEYTTRGASGDYYLIFNNGAPFQVVTYHGPIQSFSKANYTGVYGQDAWKMGRFVLNLGLRYDRNSAWVPDQSLPGGNFTNPYHQPRVDVPTFNEFGPRIHFAYDLTGKGKTVVKGGWGQYNSERSTDDLSGMNGAASRTTTYRWNDRNGNKQWDAGEVDLSVSGPDYVSGGGPDPTGTLRIANPDEKGRKQNEFSVSFEHEIVRDLGVRVSGVYVTNYNLRATDIVGRPLDSWNVPITRLDPGPDGVVGNSDDPGTSLTYWEYATALRAPTFGVNRAVNLDGKTNRNKGIDLALSKRSSHNWQMLVSGGYIWVDDDIVGEPQLTPNALLFIDDHHTDWYFKTGGSYRFTKPGILASVNANATSGQYWFRTVRMTGGTTVPTQVVPVEPRNARRYPNAFLLDARAEKTFRLSGPHVLSVRLDMFNLLNTNVTSAVTTQSGPSFNQPITSAGSTQGIMPPRVLQASVSYKF